MHTMHFLYYYYENIKAELFITVLLIDGMNPEFDYFLYLSYVGVHHNKHCLIINTHMNNILGYIASSSKFYYYELYCA